MDKLRAEAVSVHFGSKKVLDEVSLSMPSRSVTALIGPSGCGKTSFLRSLNRMHDVTPQARVSGEVLLDGQNIYAPHIDAVEVRRHIGMVFQRYNPFPKSIFDNVAFGLRIAGRRDRRQLGELVEKALRSAALWDEVKDRLTESALGLSGGQQQRLCVARAIAVAPQVLLMDEPTSALDPIATAKLEELILQLRADFTLVMVTHSLQQARRLSDHVAFFYLGKLVETGTTETVFSAPRETQTRAYLEGRFG